VSFPIILRVLIAGLTCVLFVTLAVADSIDLPRRISQTPATTNSVPHIQIGVEVDPALSAELLRLAATIQGVEIRETVVSLPGAKGFWINENVTITRPESIAGGREFAHMHPDGSLHASLPPELAINAVKRGWATFHPWSTQRPGWDGFVMIYTPQSMGELQVIIRLVNESYKFVTGKS